MSYGFRISIVLVAACGAAGPPASPDPSQSPDAGAATTADARVARSAEATLTNKSGAMWITADNERLDLTDREEGAGELRFSYVLSGAATSTAPPFSLRIHDVGDCSATDAASAGAPSAQFAALPGDARDGDIAFNGGLKASLDPAASDTLIGKAVVIHELTNVTDATGKRVACGVIATAQVQ